MLSFHRREIKKERALAEQALELFLKYPRLRWSDAYFAAAFERTAGTERLEEVLTLAARRCCPLSMAVALSAPEDTQLPPPRPL
jgi:hypothetical protein